MEEEIHTIEEDAIITGVASINGQTGDLNLKTVNGNDIIGTGNIEIQAGVTSVNGNTGEVTITASGIGAATSSDLQTLANTVAGKQNALTTDQMAAVNSGIDSTKVGQIATNTQGISDEITARQNADVGLQNQIDGLAASSDVTDIVGTKAALNAYDTTKLKDNDIIKVLQDESQDDETTYYRWSITTQTFTLIGEEGPYYTKSQTNTLLNAKQDDLVAGTNITIAADGKTISATDTTYSNFVGTDGTAAGSAGLVPAPATTDSDKFLKSDGTWEGINSGPTVVQTTGTSQTDVMSQKATTEMVYKDASALKGVQVDGQIRGSSFIQGAVAIGGRADDGGIAIGYNNNGYGANAKLSGSIAIGQNAVAGGSASTNAVAIGGSAQATAGGAVALGRFANATTQGQMDIGVSNATWAASEGYLGTQYRLLSGVHDPVNAHDAATKGYVDGTTEVLTIADADWSALSSSDPYTYSATKTLTATIGVNSTVELLNDSAVDFATYGFAIGSVDQPNNTITLYSIGAPSASKTLKVNIKA